MGFPPKNYPPYTYPPSTVLKPRPPFSNITSMSSVVPSLDFNSDSQAGAIHGRVIDETTLSNTGANADLQLWRHDSLVSTGLGFGTEVTGQPRGITTDNSFHEYNASNHASDTPNLIIASSSNREHREFTQEELEQSLLVSGIHPARRHLYDAAFVNGDPLPPVELNAGVYLYLPPITNSHHGTNMHLLDANTLAMPNTNEPQFVQNACPSFAFHTPPSQTVGYIPGQSDNGMSLVNANTLCNTGSNIAYTRSQSIAAVPTFVANEERPGRKAHKRVPNGLFFMDPETTMDQMSTGRYQYQRIAFQPPESTASSNRKKSRKPRVDKGMPKSKPVHELSTAENLVTSFKRKFEDIDVENSQDTSRKSNRTQSPSSNKSLTDSLAEGSRITVPLAEGTKLEAASSKEPYKLSPSTSHVDDSSDSGIEVTEASEGNPRCTPDASATDSSPRAGLNRKPSTEVRLAETNLSTPERRLSQGSTASSISTNSDVDSGVSGFEAAEYSSDTVDSFSTGATSVEDCLPVGASELELDTDMIFSKLPFDQMQKHCRDEIDKYF